MNNSFPDYMFNLCDDTVYDDYLQHIDAYRRKYQWMEGIKPSVDHDLDDYEHPRTEYVYFRGDWYPKHLYETIIKEEQE